MARALTAKQVAVALDRAESAMDHAVAEVAGLAALLPQARVRAELSAVTGQRVFEGISETLAGLTQARGRLVETHRRLDALGQAMGVQVHATGPLDKPEEDGPRNGGGVSLIRAAG